MVNDDDEQKKSDEKRENFMFVRRVWYIYCEIVLKKKKKIG